MADLENEHDPVLDAEYRELVRSLHKDTIAAVSLVDAWWNGKSSMTPIPGMNGRAEDEAVDSTDQQWRDEIRPAPLPLINGHPDPVFVMPPIFRYAIAWCDGLDASAIDRRGAPR